jgi:hypothetical protein
VHLSFTLAIDSRFVSDTVTAAVQQALLDPQSGLFGSKRIGIGEVIYASQIYEACLSAPGALAVHDVRLGATSFSPVFLSTLVSANSLSTISRLLGGASYRFDPGEGGYFSLDSSALTMTPEVSADAG